MKGVNGHLEFEDADVQVSPDWQTYRGEGIEQLM